MEPVFADDSRDITPRTEMSPKDNPASDFKNGNSDKTESLNVPLVRDDDFAMPEDTQVVEKESTVSEFLDLPGKAYEQAGYWRDLALSAERAGLEPVIPSGSVDVVLFDAFSAKLSSEDEKKRLRSEVKKWLKKPVVREKFTAEDRELVLSAWKGKKGFGNQATVIALSEVTGITARLWLPRGPRLYKPSVPKDGLKVDVAIPGLGEYVAFQAKKASSSPRLVTRDVMFLESSTLLPGMESNSHSVSELHSDNAVKTRKLVEMSVDEAEFVFGSRPRQALKASIGTDEVLEFSKGEVFMKDGDYYLTPAQEERLHAYRSLDLLRSKKVEVVRAPKSQQVFYSNVGWLVGPFYVLVAAIFFIGGLVLVSLAARGDYCLNANGWNASACPNEPLRTNATIGVVSGMSIGVQNVAAGLMAASLSSPFLVTNVFQQSGKCGSLILTVILWLSVGAFDIICIIIALAQSHSETFVIVIISLSLTMPFLAALVARIGAVVLNRAETRLEEEHPV